MVDASKLSGYSLWTLKHLPCLIDNDQQMLILNRSISTMYRSRSPITRHEKPRPPPQAQTGTVNRDSDR